jgi:cyclic pyranopterin phosphate synthase
MIVSIPGIDDCAATTNGFFLAEQAVGLKEAGLHRINISLDSLDPETFTAMTRRDSYDKVWQGIEAADAAGLRPIKINAVLVRGVNEADIPRFAQLARERGFIPRLIEFMPIGQGDGWTRDQVVTGAEVIAAMERATGVRLIPVERPGAQPADRFQFEDGRGEIGFISSVSEPFCGNCNRVRITSDGKFRTCLFSLKETDLRALLRGGASDAEIEAAIRTAIHHKEEGHLINDPAFVRPQRTMSQIGG